MFFSDLFVALAFYHKDFKIFMLWREIMVVATYVPAWTVLVLVATEENPYVKIKMEKVLQTDHTN